MTWRNQPRLDEQVYIGTCPVCGKIRIHKKHEGKAVYCSDCEVWDYNSSLMSFSTALALKQRK